MLPIRANANTVINENAPTDARALLAYYNLEQYPWNRVFTTTNGDGEPISYRWHFLAIIVAYQVFIRVRKRLKKQ